MFNWSSKESELKKARLRKAYRTQLSEVLGLPEDDIDPSETLRQPQSESALEMNAEPELSPAS